MFPRTRTHRTVRSLVSKIFKNKSRYFKRFTESRNGIESRTRSRRWPRFTAISFYKRLSRISQVARSLPPILPSPSTSKHGSEKGSIRDSTNQDQLPARCTGSRLHPPKCWFRISPCRNGHPCFAARSSGYPGKKGHSLDRYHLIATSARTA